MKTCTALSISHPWALQAKNLVVIPKMSASRVLLNHNLDYRSPSSCLHVSRNPGGAVTNRSLPEQRNDGRQLPRLQQHKPPAPLYNSGLHSPGRQFQVGRTPFETLQHIISIVLVLLLCWLQYWSHSRKQCLHKSQGPFYWVCECAQKILWQSSSFEMLSRSKVLKNRFTAVFFS